MGVPEVDVRRIAPGQTLVRLSNLDWGGADSDSEHRVVVAWHEWLRGGGGRNTGLPRCSLLLVAELLELGVDHAALRSLIGLRSVPARSLAARRLRCGLRLSAHKPAEPLGG